MCSRYYFYGFKVLVSCGFLHINHNTISILTTLSRYWTVKRNVQCVKNFSTNCIWVRAVLLLEKVQPDLKVVIKHHTTCKST